MLALADNSKLFVPQGRMSPISFDMATGTAQGRLAGAGGSWTLITPDNGRVAVGPSYGYQYDQRATRFLEDSPTARTIVAAHDRAHALLVSGGQSYLFIEDKVLAKNRASGTTAWLKEIGRPSTMITGGTTLYVGGATASSPSNTANGSLLREFTVTGDVFALALANGTIVGQHHARDHPLLCAVRRASSRCARDARLPPSVADVPWTSVLGSGSDRPWRPQAVKDGSRGLQPRSTHRLFICRGRHRNPRASLTPQIPLIRAQIVEFDKSAELLRKRRLRMMLALMGDG